VEGKWLRILYDVRWKVSGSGYFPISSVRKVAQGFFDE